MPLCGTAIVPLILWTGVVGRDPATCCLEQWQPVGIPPTSLYTTGQCVRRRRGRREKFVVTITVGGTSNDDVSVELCLGRDCCNTSTATAAPVACDAAISEPTVFAGVCTRGSTTLPFAFVAAPAN